MPTLPVPTQTDATSQSTTTGAVDYLEYVGNQLVASDQVDYGLGTNWKVVASGNFDASGNQDLVAQSQSTGQLDFLYLDTTAHLVSSVLTAGSFPTVDGAGFFGFASIGSQQGPTLISQLSNGELDFLAFGTNTAGTPGSFLQSDLVPSTVGLPKLVGGGNQTTDGPEFNGIGPAFDPGSVITQLSNGELDAIGFTGDITTGLAVDQTFIMPQTTGLSPVQAVNPDSPSAFSGTQTTSSDVVDSSGTLYGVQLLTQPSAGTGDAVYLDAGFDTTTPPGATEGDLYASQTLPLTAGYQYVNGSMVALSLFPVT